MRDNFARLAVATVFVGLTIAGHQCGMAYADPLTRDGGEPTPAAVASDIGSTHRSSAPDRKARTGHTAGATSARGGRDGAVPRVAASVASDRNRAKVPALTGSTPLSPTALATVPQPTALAGALSTPAADLRVVSVPTPTAARTAVAPRKPWAAPLPAAAALQPSPAAAQMRSIGGGLNTLLTDTANWLAELPGGPITQLLEGAVYLTRRTLFPTSVGVVNKPIVVPLHLTDVSGGPNQKLGIYVGFGSDATPALFELDTGGAGIYGAYASSSPNNSQWWGSGVVTTSNPVQVLYDSGNSYTGFAATSQVYLYSADGTAPLLATGRATVGQMDNISNGNTPLWTPNGLPPGTSTPPINEAFYGDFGLSQQYSTNGITNALAQLTYTRGVLPGYRIHTDQATNTAWLQIGLTNADLEDPGAAYFPEVIDPKAPSSARNPNSRLRYYSQQVFNANIKISTTGPTATTIINSVDVGMTADTGASTTLHNTDLTSIPLPTQYAGITEKGNLEAGLTFNVTGTTKSGAQAQVFNFTTLGPSDKPDLGVVSVQNNKPGNTTYYLNTGILLFYQNDVVYYLGDRAGGGLIGLI